MVKKYEVMQVTELDRDQSLLFTLKIFISELQTPTKTAHHYRKIKHDETFISRDSTAEKKIKRTPSCPWKAIILSYVNLS